MRARALRRVPRSGAFTLVEMLVSIVVLALLVALIARIFSTTASLTGRNTKRMDTDAQARAVLDRMAIDFGRMVRRADVDYYLKGRPATNSQQGGGTVSPNDQIAFYSEVAGYYPSTGSQSPVSLVAYRINTQFGLQGLERLGKGLVWNGVATTDTPVVFLPIPLASPLPAPLPSPMPASAPAPAWPQAASMDADGDYELVGPQVFRFEYYYVLNGQAANAAVPPATPPPSVLSSVPWDTRPPLGHAGVNGWQDVAAIGVAIAVVDSRSRSLVTEAQLGTLAGQMPDFDPSMKMGGLETQWTAAINANAANLPVAVLPAIRVYGRCFYLSPRMP